MDDEEFQTEVSQSLERAFTEGHSVDTAAVELKTLRMASNVPLIRVREAVVGAIVEKIKLVEGDPSEQRKEIAKVTGRWGELIDKIGGVDPVETVSVLQAHCAKSTRMPLFGQILAALYQEDIVEEDHIRAWHLIPASKGEDLKDSAETENFRKCWMIGSHMIHQFNAQDSETETDTETESDGDEKNKKQPQNKKQDSSSDSESSSDDSIQNKQKLQAKKKKESSSSSSDSDSSSDEGTPPPTPAATARARKPIISASSDSDSDGNADTASEAAHAGESESASEDVSASENSSAAPSAATSEDESETTGSAASGDERYTLV